LFASPLSFLLCALMLSDVEKVLTTHPDMGMEDGGAAFALPHQSVHTYSYTLS
jgi:hypothetical protein